MAEKSKQILVLSDVSRWVKERTGIAWYTLSLARNVKTKSKRRAIKQGTCKLYSVLGEFSLIKKMRGNILK